MYIKIPRTLNHIYTYIQTGDQGDVYKDTTNTKSYIYTHIQTGDQGAEARAEHQGYAGAPLS